MPISESQLPANILTKCSKMSEGHKLHGINGNADGNTKVECQKPSYGQGGRLKFFKDGKFILELERALEGERVSWVSVHRKTYWPPQGTTATIPSYRQESSTSLSVSDDNSSMQSSPWQRDHSWKQTCPSRNISSHMNFYFWKPKSERVGTKSKKRRTPYSIATEHQSNCDSVMAQKKHGKQSLMSIIQNLIDKHFQTSTLPRAESVVSPRKRFLREMEKDKILVDDSCQKRSRNKPQTFTSSCSSFSPIGKSVLSHNIEENTRSTARNCSYSITSLLTEDRIRKKSPNNSPSHCSPIPQPMYCSSTPEDGWYSESVDRLRSIELTQPEKCTIPPPYHHPHQSFAGPYMYPFQPVPPYYSSGLYGRGYLIPSMYHGAGMPLAIRQESPSCSWVIEADKELGRDNATADKPLNLSKHPG